MYFDSFAELLQMGKHGFYVWTAYGATVLVLLLAQRARRIFENVATASAAGRASPAQQSAQPSEDRT